MDGADKYLLRQAIAASLDYPSVYMGGPSPHSVRKAVRIVEMLMDEYEIAPRERAKADAERVKTWRTSPWDSLERT